MMEIEDDYSMLPVYSHELLVNDNYCQTIRIWTTWTVFCKKQAQHTGKVYMFSTFILWNIQNQIFDQNVILCFSPPDRHVDNHRLHQNPPEVLQITRGTSKQSAGNLWGAFDCVTQDHMNYCKTL